MARMLGTATLANTNSSKVLELEDGLASALRDVVSGRDELDATTFSSDEVESIAATLFRVARLYERRDLTSWVDDDDGGKQTSAWDIISPLMERGRLGRKEEQKVRIEYFFGWIDPEIAKRACGCSSSLTPSQS
jgi:cohesin complex subunit SA-1/2